MTGTESLLADLPDWRVDTADRCIDAARDHEREARRLRELAAKILHPPEGVTVELAWPHQNAVRFVGPTVDHTKRRKRG